MKSQELIASIIDLAKRLEYYEKIEKQLKYSIQEAQILQYNRVISYFSGFLNEGFESVESQIIDNGLRETLDFLIGVGLSDCMYFDFRLHGILYNPGTGRAIKNIDEFLELLREAKKEYGDRIGVKYKFGLQSD